MLNERLSEMTHNSYSNHNDSIWNETCWGWFESINRSTVNHYYLYPLSYKQEHSNKHTSYWNHHSSSITTLNTSLTIQSLQIYLYSYTIRMMSSFTTHQSLSYPLIILFIITFLIVFTFNPSRLHISIWIHDIYVTDSLRYWKLSNTLITI